MSKYIDAEKLIAEIKRLIKVNKELKSSRFTEGIAAGYGDVLSAIVSFQQDKETLELCSKIWWEEQGWIMIPPDVTVEGIDSLLRQVKKKLQQEQPEIDGDDGKFIKILVRKEFAELFQKLGDKIQAGQSSFIGAMNQQEQLEEHPDNFTSFEWLIGRFMFRGCDLLGMTDGEDDNGVVTKLIKDRAAEMLELLERELDINAEPVDLEKEIDNEWKKCNPIDEGMGVESAYIHIEAFDIIARHFYERGRKQVLQEIYDGKTKPVDKINAAYLDD